TVKRPVSGSSTASSVSSLGCATSTSSARPSPRSRPAEPAGPPAVGCTVTMRANGSQSTTRGRGARSGSTMGCTSSLESDGEGHVAKESADALDHAVAPLAQGGRPRGRVVVGGEAAAPPGVPEGRPLGGLPVGGAAVRLGAVRPGCGAVDRDGQVGERRRGLHRVTGGAQDAPAQRSEAVVDRKSTRLNSSHVKISYAVF